MTITTTNIANEKYIGGNGRGERDAQLEENREWLEALDYILDEQGPDRVRELLQTLTDAAQKAGIHMPFTANTPYVNTIPAEASRPIPATARSSGGSRASSAGTRWRWWSGRTANTTGSAGTSPPSPRAATLYEVAFNHFFRGRTEAARRRRGLFPGPRRARHVRPGVPGGPARPSTQLHNFRQELRRGRRALVATRTRG